MPWPVCFGRNLAVKCSEFHSKLCEMECFLKEIPVKSIVKFAAALSLGMFMLPALGAAGSCEIPANAQALAQKALNLTNERRAQRGRNPLIMHPKLMASAQAYACELSTKGYTGHRGRDGSTPKRRLARERCHGGLVAENLGRGQTTSENVVQMWMDSPGHRKNMLLGRGVKYYGLGIANSGLAYTHGYVWVMVVSRRC